MNRRLFLASLGATLAAGCSGSTGGGSDESTSRGTTPNPTPAPTPGETIQTPSPPDITWPVRGVSLSPRSFEPEDFRAFFDLVAEANLAVRWAGDWAELGQDQGVPAYIANQAKADGLVSIIDTGVFSVSQGELFRPLDQQTVDGYVEDATTFADRHHPTFFGLGTEVNIHADEQPDEFETFVSLFEETANAVKSVSPDTQLYVSFQLEWLMGLRGGLFGGTNDPGQAQWDLLDRFPEADLVGLTTYPGLIYQDPAAIPADYFTAIAERTDRPLAIVETGWVHDRGEAGPEWASTEAEQAAFVARLDELTADLELAALVWLFVYRQAGVGPPFDAMDLRRPDGTARPAWDAWVENST